MKIFKLLVEMSLFDARWLKADNDFFRWASVTLCDNLLFTRNFISIFLHVLYIVFVIFLLVSLILFSLVL